MLLLKATFKINTINALFIYFDQISILCVEVLLSLPVFSHLINNKKKQ